MAAGSMFEDNAVRIGQQIAECIKVNSLVPFNKVCLMCPSRPGSLTPVSFVDQCYQPGQVFYRGLFHFCHRAKIKTAKARKSKALQAGLSIIKP